MYGLAQQESWQQRREEIRQELAAIRLEKAAREYRGGRFRLMRDTKWDLERHTGLLLKRLRRSV
jgi:hypothetical protein